MNSMKFIARYAAVAALITGVSSQAAGQGCPLNVGCDPDWSLYVTDPADNNDSYGPDLVPFAPPGQGPSLFLDQFDPDFYATLHNVPVTDIELKGIELRMTTTVEEMLVRYHNDNTSAGCQFTWFYTVQTELLPQTLVGAPDMVVPHTEDEFVDLAPGSGNPPPPWQYEWLLSLNGGPQSQTECFGDTTPANLAAWTGTGQIEFGTESEATDVDDSGCGGLTKQYNNSALMELNVVFFYCVKTPDIPPPGECTCIGPSPHYRQPGSLLLYPEFDNREGDVTVITVTNTDCINSNGDSIDIEFHYIDKEGCSKSDKTETLTACDTLTLLTNIHNPNHEQGYMYLFAKNDSGEPIVWNHLIGSVLVISGLETFDYSMNPVAYMGIGSLTGVPQPDGTLTDLDGDGLRDLDKTEYDPSPDVITIPRFLGQDEEFGGGFIQSQLILIGLSGGRLFETTACFNFYNDNEEGFSAEYTFSCWDKPYLRDISFGFQNEFLKTTDHDPLEIIGAPQREAGWICVMGCEASSDQETIEYPSIYAVLVERVGSWGVADLPFECGERINGSLIPNHQLGDGDPTPVDGDNQ